MKVFVILLIGLVVTELSVKRSAALRHWVLAITMFCALLMPAFEILAPAWYLPVSNRVEVAAAANSTTVEESVAIPVRSTAVDSPSSMTVRAGLRIVWLAGSLMSFVILFAGLGRLTWLAHRAREVSDRNWVSLLGSVRLLQSEHPTLLVTWGFFRPVIILPSSARHWSDERMRIVLWHELAHIRRHDWFLQMMAETLRAMYWFNPLAWIASKRLRFESEQACDDSVLARGIDGQSYAAVLLGLARDLKHGQDWLPAPAMARRSSLNRRVSAMLNAHVNRRPLSAASRIVIVLAILGLTIPIAAAQSFARLSGSVVDGQGLPLPNASLVLSNAERSSKYEVRSTATGTFEFVGLPAGMYTFDVSAPGFAVAHHTLPIMSGQNLERVLTLKVGSLQETIVVTGDKEGPPPILKEARPFAPTDLSACVPLSVGGNIRAPKKLRDMAPEYPAALRGSGTEGTVVLDTKLGVDGFVKDIEIRDGSAPEFADAAITAVREWRYSQTILNCMPIEVPMTVTMRFRQTR
jgi:TonB family protein